MLAIVMAALVGGPVTAALFWPEGGIAAILAAPLGGSLCAALTAIALGSRSAATVRARATRPVSARFGAEWHASAH
ncbi:hypothetical protein [Methylobacterium sp. JK268]